MGCKCHLGCAKRHDVPLSEDKGKEESIVVHENQNDLMAETFRNVRTNVLYMMRSDEKVILVTSTTTGEGKTLSLIHISSGSLVFTVMVSKSLGMMCASYRGVWTFAMFRSSDPCRSVSYTHRDATGGNSARSHSGVLR